MFGVCLIDDAVAIRKLWENWEAEILSPSGKLGRKGTPGRGDMLVIALEELQRQHKCW